MRHNKKFNHLGRKSAHRKAMLSNMTSSLILHKRITTTVAKAKALKIYAEPLITKAKQDTTHSRRVVFSYLQNKEAVTELFREISPKIADRPGGYTRILKTGSRVGDSANMCIIELVDFNENMLAAKEEKKTTSRRRRSGSKKASTTTAAPKAEKAEKVEEAKVVEEVVEEAPVVEEVATETVEEAPAVEDKAEEAPAVEEETPVAEEAPKADEEDKKEE